MRNSLDGAGGRAGMGGVGLRVGVAVLLMGTIALTVTHVAAGDDREPSLRADPACGPSSAPVPTSPQANAGGQAAGSGADAAVPLTDQYDPGQIAAPQGSGDPHDHSGSAGPAKGGQQARTPADCPPTAGAPAASAPGPSTAPLEILGRDCRASTLPPHDGFQAGPRCVDTAFGEVAAAAGNPSLLIVSAPSQVSVGAPFVIEVSTRNLVRDRFLPAKSGGYYLESAFLNQEGLTRGHFHTACRMLVHESAAPDPAPVPAFFVATEDGGGGSDPDVVAVQVPGLPTAGVAQCASWAGDGSHRIPMMERANQIPAFDVVRVQVVGPAASSAASPGGSGAEFSVASPETRLLGSAALADCPTCAEGKMATFDESEFGKVLFPRVDAAAAGRATVSIVYANGGTAPLRAALRVNREPGITLTFPPSGGSQTFVTLGVAVTLQAGENTLSLSNGFGEAPNLDKIVVIPAA